MAGKTQGRCFKSNVQPVPHLFRKSSRWAMQSQSTCVRAMNSRGPASTTTRILLRTDVMVRCVRSGFRPVTLKINMIVHMIEETPKKGGSSVFFLSSSVNHCWGEDQSNIVVSDASWLRPTNFRPVAIVHKFQACCYCPHCLGWASSHFFPCLWLQFPFL